MEENKDYRAYRYGDHLEPGYELKVEHSVSCEDVDISALIAMGTESLAAMRQGSIDGEQKAYDIVVAAAKQWEQQAAATQMIDRAISYLRTPEVEHTGNQWKDTDNWRSAQEISNRVYKMTCSVREDTKYDRETKQSVPVAWYVTWDLYINSPKDGYGKKIAGQNQKRYTDKAAAMKYLEGRKKSYSHLFTEVSPPVPKEYLKELKASGEELSPKEWRREIDLLTAQKQVDSIDMKAMREELKAVERLRKAADQLARQERDKPRDRGPER